MKDSLDNIWENSFRIINVFKKKTKYFARSWDEQIVYKFLLDYDRERIIECMLIFHYNNHNIHDVTIEISNMYNCIVGCKFCASGNLKNTVFILEKEDYIAQINTCLKACSIDPNKYKNFFISFYGIGEPSVVFKQISDAIIIIKSKYHHARFNIATFGFDINCFGYWEKNVPYIRTLQIPYYSGNIKCLKKLVRNLPDGYNFIEILKKALLYKRKYNFCRVKINYIVIWKINDANEDIEKLLKILIPYRKEICIRISYLNYTKVGEDEGFKSASTKTIQNVYTKISSSGFECYIFGSENNIEVGCGQLLQDYISANIDV